jgi:hypothetical protein
MDEQLHTGKQNTASGMNKSAVFENEEIQGPTICW